MSVAAATRHNLRVAHPTGDDLTPIELLVLYEAGGDNDLGNAYGAVQLYAVFDQEEDLLDATQSALLRLFDLGLVRFVEAPEEVGYTAQRHDLPAMSRDKLVARLESNRRLEAQHTVVFYDPTPQESRAQFGSSRANPSSCRDRATSLA
jgi:hypothetical protein